MKIKTLDHLTPKALNMLSVAQSLKGIRSIVQGIALRKLRHPICQAESPEIQMIASLQDLDGYGIFHHVGRCPTLLITRLSALVRSCATSTMNNPVQVPLWGLGATARGRENRRQYLYEKNSYKLNNNNYEFI